MKKFIWLTVLLIACSIGQTNTYAENLNEPAITSTSAILLDGVTGTTLYEKNADQKMYPASLTKIATAIYALENGKLDDVVTVSKNARSADGTRVYLEMGEQVPMLKLIQGLLINSGNDAGIAIAEHLSGTEEQFGKDLTDFLIHKIGTTNTKLTNGTGLYDVQHMTTARDLALITQYAMQNEQFMEIFGTQALQWVGLSWQTTLESHHRMVNGQIAYDGITGGKTGYIPESKYTLATTAQRDSLHLIVIVLGGTNHGVYKDTKALLNYGFEGFEQVTIDPNSANMLESTSYIVPEAVSYVKKINDAVSLNITAHGHLQLFNEAGMLIKEAPLVMKPVAQQHYKELKLSSGDPVQMTKDEPKKTGLPFIVFLSIAAIFVFSRMK